ncbi:glycerol-3-phosphate dehydrogenase/oxidase [Siminovitchia fortis]|uniref:glycerol-3-phosphate dehydrogenase/oxidase n=1 Tax=Siminovitchia fortis TaxID=254758 RepID=UPI0011A1C3F1|nr:glycerol-3-phosphate dehydrogenase/oxidase [Siminovitchia fortis]
MRTFSFIERKRLLKRLGEKHYDVIIIGGGITGTGIALDCVTRGLKTLLVEMQDFAAGTSSRSTKLVHGGLRYLKQFEINMVAEVGKERAIVYENAPHVTHPEWMLLPIYKKGTFGKLSTSAGLRVYDFLAGVKKNEKRQMLSREETLAKEPLLKKDGLIGGGYYVEYRTDDARLTIEVAKKAFEKGADLLNYTKAEGFLYEGGKISGVKVRDVFTDKLYEATCQKVVNATGPWVEKIIEKDKKIKGKGLIHTKGVHIVIDNERFPLKQAVYFDTPDGRMVFAIPRDGKTYVGTTDTFFEGDLSNPPILEEDKEYLISCIQYMFPDLGINIDDIESGWSGVRPLIQEEGKGPSEISRKDEIWVSESGLITIAGGKLTGYRKMAETVTDMLAKLLDEDGIKSSPCITRKLRLSGGEFESPKEYELFIGRKSKELQEIGLCEEDARRIAAVYGTNADIVASMESLLLPDVELPLTIKLLVHYSIMHEMAITPEDLFIRRTGASLFNVNWVRKWEEPVTLYMKKCIDIITE